MKQYKEYGIAFKNLGTGKINYETFIANSEENALYYFGQSYRRAAYEILEVIEL